MDDLVVKLTDNFQYATDIILILIMENDYTSMNYLEYLDIVGKRLDNLKNCMPEISYDYIQQTVRFLRSGFLSIEDIQNNLDSANPVYFISRLLKNGENWEMAYEDFAGDFNTNISKNKSR